ncbi:MAG: Gfo/Idh/MocA family oxidoreductase [Fimbriimonadaceae bacterium]|nr:Gfo/Idh/MocA family oxidoreductase [Fimbriimonadaceae bacterium]
MAAAPLRIGLIGCGNNQRGAHLPRLAKCAERGEVVIVAGCDPLAENLAKVQEQVPGLVPYADHHALLAGEALDAVVISTPHTLHYQQILDSFAAGCHVLTEKPMCCSVAEARELLARRDALGKHLQIGYQRHFLGGYRWVRQQIASGAAGAVRFVTAWQAQDWLSGQLAKGGTWRIAAGLSGGGQLNDSGSHLVDIILWMTGLQPTAVSAAVDHRGQEVDILSAVTAECDGGAIASLSVIGESVLPFGEQIVIWCDHATFELVGFGDPVRVTWDSAKNQTLTVPPEERPHWSDPDANFVAALLGREPLEVPGECGLRTIALTAAAWEAARSGGRVSVER